MSLSTLTVEIALTTDTLTVPGAGDWTDITAWCRGLTRGMRGRQREDAVISAGRYTLVLDNRDGRFDPANTASPYHPNFTLGRRVRIRATDPHTGIVHPLFEGFVRRTPRRFPHAAPQQDETVEVELVDGYDHISRDELPESVWTYEVDKLSPTRWWRLGETAGSTAVDAGSTPRDGTYLGEPTLGVDSLITHDDDRALQLDGSNDGVELPNAAVEYPSTVLVWANLTDNADHQTLFVQGDRRYPSLVLGVYGNARFSDPRAVFMGQSETGDSITALRDSTNLVMGGVHMVTASWDGTIMYLGVDDNARLSGALGFTPYTTSKARLLRPWVGQDGGLAPLSPASGVADEIVVFPSVLSNTQRATLYEAATVAWDGDDTGARIGRILDVIGWPASQRDIDVGQTVLGPADLGGGNPLAYMQTVEATEAGRLFVAADGDVRFISRHTMLTAARHAEPRWTFGGVAGLPYYDLSGPERDRDDVVNRATVVSADLPDITHTDTASRDSYGPGDLRVSTLHVESNEARGLSQWIVEHRAEPADTIGRLVLRPQGDDGLWEAVLGLELADRVQVVKTAVGGQTFTQELIVEGISHEWRPGMWETLLWLSPADVQTYLVLDDPVLGQLDAGNRLAF